MGEVLGGKTIVFWSTLHGQACSSNMLAAAIMIALKNNVRALMTQTHYNLNNMEKPLMGKVTEKEFYRDTGIDALMRCLKSAPLTEEIINNCTTTIVKQHLNLLVGTKQANRLIYETDTEKSILKILREAVKYYDFVFVDTNSGRGTISSAVLGQADVIVLNLKQNTDMIDNFFHGNYSIEKEKVFYLFGAYDKNSKYSIKNIRRKYKDISSKNSGIIPYNIEFADAISDGNVLRYIEKNILSDDENESYGFLYEVFESAKKILIKAGVLS